MITNYWDKYKGITIGGVISNNSVEFLNDEIFNGNSIDLDYEAFLEENSDVEEEDFPEYESNGDSTYLIGNWLKDESGKYYPDPDGEYAAICGEIYTQVVFSKYTKLCALCSPCYPGQGDLDSVGEFLTYNLPADLIGNLV